MYPFLDIATFHDAVRAEYPDVPLYCIGDHGGMPGLHRELQRAGIAWNSLFAASSEDKALEVAPLLFSVDEARRDGGRGLLHWIAEHGTYTSSLLFLASPLDGKTLARRLARRLDAVIQDDIEIMLRFFDPRVFEALVEVLTERQAEEFLGCAIRWYYLDREGKMLARASTYDDMDRFHSPLHLAPAQEDALVAASVPDDVAMRLMDIVPEQLLRLPRPLHHPFILRQLKAAKVLGIRSPQELALYCAAALLDGEGFDNSPRWRHTIDEVRRGRISFSDAISAVGA